MKTLEALPTSVDHHPQVLRQARQRQELEEKLAAGRTHRAALDAEGVQLRSALHESNVALVLGHSSGEPSESDHASRLSQLQREIDAANAYEAAVLDAIQRHDVIAAGIREQVAQDMRQQLEASVRDVVAQMAPKVREVIELNQQLIALAQRVPGLIAALPAPGLLIMFEEQSRAYLGAR
jgi:predicted  nucleic acid-binding Zn-ribbon protein